MKDFFKAITLLVPLTLAAGEVRGHLIDIPKGSFVPLFPDSETSEKIIPEKVNVSAFQIQVDPVTNEDFLKFIEANPQWKKTAANPLYVNEVYLKHWDTDLLYPSSIRRTPVTNVSWFAASAYCHWLGFRLPTTDEWEYLASFPLVFNKKQISEKDKTRKILEWYSEPSGSRLSNVDQASKNSVGVRGLFGLVWEWTYDFNSVLMTNDNRSNSDKKNGLFCGGGALGSNNPEDYARFMRYAHRSSLTGRYSAANLGFRCAK